MKTVLRPILLQGTTRSLTQIKYNREGDLLFTVSKDKAVNVWYSTNGERLGTYNGHVGAVWSVDVDSSTEKVVTGSADNTARLWNVKTGECIYVWEFNTAVKRVEFSEDGKMILCVTEERMGFEGTITIMSVDEPDSSKPIAVIKNAGSKAVVAGWGYLDKYIISCHINGEICQWDWRNQTKLKEVKGHSGLIMDMQFDPSRTYFITASKDKTAKIFDVDTLEKKKEYATDTQLNSGSITPKPQDFVILGGGQDAASVTTTSAREGKFESRFYHKILEEELGRIRGHFGPINTISVNPDGKSFASGGEDGFVRVHHFEPKSDYNTFKVKLAS